MTCIVAIAEEGVVYMGGDRFLAAGSNGTKFREGSPKIGVIEVDNEPEFLVGIAGDGRAADVLLRADLGPYPLDDPEDNLRRLFIPAARNTLATAGALMKFDDGQDRGAAVLVGHRGELFVVYENFGLQVVTEGYAAIGSAKELALGSLASTFGDPAERLKIALRAAEKHSTTVMGPFDLLKL